MPARHPSLQHESCVLAQRQRGIEIAAENMAENGLGVRRSAASVLGAHCIACRAACGPLRAEP